VNVPRYWAKVEGDTPPDFEGARRLAVWGWSQESQRGAELHAHKRLTEVLDHLRHSQGWPKGYTYGSRPRREEILQEFRDRGGETTAFLTRTHYGSEILNVARVLFVDVDVPRPSIKQVIGSLFGSKNSPEAGVLSRIRSALAGEPDGSFTIYRTAAGFRVVAGDPLYEPASPKAEALMIALGVDPSYLNLCRVQQCFRARLTPKPWRCGMSDPPGRYPRGADDEAAHAQWVSDYERATHDKATCQTIETLGWRRIHEEAEEAIRLHDRKTRADSNLPLA
jgi:hypothetical protein